MCLRLPELLTGLAPPGEAFVASQAPSSAGHWGDEFREFMVVGEVPGFVSVWQALKVVAVGYAPASPGLPQVA
jgi:hypothetical protein